MTFKTFTTVSLIALLAAPVMANNGKGRGNDNKTVTTSGNSKEFTMAQWVDMSFSADMTEDANAKVKGNGNQETSAQTTDTASNAATSDWEDITITTRANADHDIDIQFNCAVLDGNIVPAFLTSGETSEVDAVVGQMIVTMVTDNGQSEDTVLASLDGNPGSEESTKGSVSNLSSFSGTTDDSAATSGTSDVSVSVKCDTSGNGIVLIKVDQAQTQTNTYSISGKMYAENGAAIISDGVVTTLTGETPAGNYEMGLNVGATITTDPTSTDASTYVSGSAAAEM